MAVVTPRMRGVRPPHMVEIPGRKETLPAKLARVGAKVGRSVFDTVGQKMNAVASRIDRYIAPHDNTNLTLWMGRSILRNSPYALVDSEARAAGRRRLAMAGAGAVSAAAIGLGTLYAARESQDWTANAWEPQPSAEAEAGSDPGVTSDLGVPAAESADVLFPGRVFEAGVNTLVVSLDAAGNVVGQQPTNR